MEKSEGVHNSYIEAQQRAYCRADAVFSGELFERLSKMPAPSPGWIAANPERVIRDETGRILGFWKGAMPVQNEPVEDNNPVPAWARGQPLLESAWHEYAVWEYLPTGRLLRTFPDADLAAQFCINNGGRGYPEPAQLTFIRTAMAQKQPTNDKEQKL